MTRRGTASTAPMAEATSTGSSPSAAMPGCREPTTSSCATSPSWRAAPEARRASHLRRPTMPSTCPMRPAGRTISCSKTSTSTGRPSASAFHFYHSNTANRNAWNVTVRRLHVTGTQQAVVLWDPTLRNITFDTATISNALDVAVRYETVGVDGHPLQQHHLDGSGSYGFYSSRERAPPACRSPTTASTEADDRSSGGGTW